MGDKNRGLIMEGGAMRGMFTAGVLDVFMEEGIDFDGAVGVSAGATFGCNIKSKQHGRTLRYNCKYCSDYRYGSFRSLLLSGDMFDVKFCYERLPYELDVFDNDTFESNPMDFYVVATDMTTGKPVYHKCKDGRDEDLMWIRASASLPLASRIVDVDGVPMLDGGISDSIPIRFFRELGYKKNVIILTRSDSYVKEKNKLTGLCKIKYRKYPEFVDTFANRHIMYNETVEYIRTLEKDSEVFVIRPEEELHIKAGESNPEELKRVYEIGRKIARARLTALKLYLD